MWLEARFIDEDGHCYGTIDKSEIDGETFVFTPDGKNEIFPDLLDEANRICKLLNDDSERRKKEGDKK